MAYEQTSLKVPPLSTVCGVCGKQLSSEHWYFKDSHMANPYRLYHILVFHLLDLSFLDTNATVAISIFTHDYGKCLIDSRIELIPVTGHWTVELVVDPSNSALYRRETILINIKRLINLVGALVVPEIARHTKNE